MSLSIRRLFLMAWRTDWSVKWQENKDQVEKKNQNNGLIQGSFFSKVTARSLYFNQSYNFTTIYRKICQSAMFMKSSEVWPRKLRFWLTNQRIARSIVEISSNCGKVCQMKTLWSTGENTVHSLFTLQRTWKKKRAKRARAQRGEGGEESEAR